MVSMLAALLALGLVGPEESKRQLPTALRDAFQYRMGLASGLVKYRVVKSRDGLETEEFREDRLNEEDILTVNLGDREGLRAWDDQGRPLIGVGHANGTEKHLYSRSRDEYWKYLEGNDEAVQGSMAMHNLHWLDVRVLGLSAVWTRSHSPLQYYESWIERAADYSWSERKTSDGRVVISADQRRPLATGKTGRIDWVIDPVCGPSVISVTYTETDEKGRKEVMARSETTYEWFDGYLFPSRFSCDERRYNEKTTVTILHGEFNRPAHPKSLSPTDLGMFVGIAVHNRQRSPGLGPGFTLRWEGTRLLEWDEWERVKHQYDTSELMASYQRRRLYGPVGGYPAWWWEPIDTVGVTDVAIMPDEWETYVRRWILRHTVDIQDPLDESQKTAAWAILKDCRRRAVPVVEAFKEQEKRLTQLEKAAARAEHATPRADPSAARAEPSTPQAEPSKSGSEKPSTDAAKSSKLSAAVPTTSAPADELSRHRRTMERRLASIFEELKQRLDKLRRANQIPSTQPRRPTPEPPSGRKGSR